MRALPETVLVVFLAFVFFLVLFSLLMILPRIIKKEEKDHAQNQIGAMMGALQVLGGEINSLKSQLVLKERLAALGEVSAGIAHELRNPMGVIGGNARLIIKGLHDDDPALELAQGILDELDEMNHVIEELLRFTKAEPLDMEDVDMTALIEDLVKSLDAGRGKIVFSGRKAIVARGDLTLLRQAIKNLVINAMEAGDRVEVKLEEGVSSNKTGVFVKVTDNGPGIPEGDREKVFMPFYSTKSKGMGIGLALVQKITVTHGGLVSVNGVEGAGSEFCLFLPYS